MTARLLSMTPFVAIGLVSYSAYLWHQPLFAFARMHFASNPPQWLMVGLCLLTFFLAWASWKFVEAPFRNPASRFYGDFRSIVIATAVFSSAFVGLGVTAIVTDGLPSRFPAAFWAKLGKAELATNVYSACQLPDPGADIEKNTCIFGAKAKPHFALIGDSHAMALSELLGEELKSYSESVRVLTAKGCIPAPNLRRLTRNRKCEAFNSAFQQFLLEPDNPEIIIMHAFWVNYFEEPDFDNGEGALGRAPDGRVIPAKAPDSFINSNERLDAVAAEIRDAVGRYLLDRKKIVLVYGVPEPGWNVPDRLAADLIFGIKRDAPLSVNSQLAEKRMRRANAILDSIPNNPNLIRVRPADNFCNNLLPGRCFLTIEGRSAYLDQNHLSKRGAEPVVQTIIEALKAKGWLEGAR